MRPLLLPSILAPAFLATSVASCGACEPRKDAPAPDASASAKAGPSVRPPPPALSAHHPPPAAKLACRAITVEGDVHVEQHAADAGLVPVLLQGVAPTEEWVDLLKPARLVVKDPRTTRETSFRAVTGPGRARVCVGFTEESWVQAGLFESSVGAGETPGAEEWVVTPFGAVRYSAARVSVDVGPKDAQVTLESGSAFAWSPSLPAAGHADAGALEDGWMRLPAGTTHLTSREAPDGIDAARTALGRCQQLATTARMLTVQVMAPDGGADGGTIAAQVVARRVARAACAIASMRAQVLPDAIATPLRQPLADANTMWSSLPPPSR